MDVHRDAIVVDLHVDTLLDLAAGRRSLDGAAPGGHIDLPRLRRGGVDVQVFAAFVHPREAAVGRRRLRELIAAFHRAVERHPAEIVAAGSVQEIEAAGRAGKIAAVLAVENGGDAIEGDVEQVDRLSRAGVRMMSLTWNQANLAADGALESRHGGLTPLGRRVVERMQTLGIVIDVSHLSPQAFWEVLAASRGPLVATHSNADAVQSHRRNLSDAQLRALAARGGVVGVNFYPPFLGAATLERVVAHIDHMVKVMGVDHVALGSDFDGITQVPQGLEDVSRLPNLTAALLARGYRPEEVQKILGGNALRVFRQVWGR
ncbi:MAG: membrane dipeptidase [Armatimonadetes bacterium]|nr:membrane dipeptidase [Armatimonadota bacterium]